MQRFVWIVTRDTCFTALVWDWHLSADGTTEWRGESCRWLPFT